jgi:NAD(P)H-dependent FMN reductase
VVGQLEERGHNVTVLDPRDTQDGFFMTLMEKAFFHYKEGEEIPVALEETAQVLKDADCYIVCSPEYNHSLPPGLANLMSYFGSKTYM